MGSSTSAIFKCIYIRFKTRKEFLRILSFDPTLESCQGNSPLKNKRSNFCPPTPSKKKETASSSKFPGYKKTATVVQLVSPKAPIIVQGIPPKIPCIIITLKVGIRKKRSTVHNSLTTDLAKQGTHVFLGRNDEVRVLEIYGHTLNIFKYKYINLLPVIYFMLIYTVNSYRIRITLLHTQQHVCKYTCKIEL